MIKFRTTRYRRIPIIYGIVSNGIRHDNHHTVDIRRPNIDDLENIGFPARFLASRDADYGDLQFDQIAGDMGYLDIPEGRALFVVDYQHRWRGFRHAIETLRETSLREVSIPVTIMSDTSQFEETKQFFLINNKQKRVDTDLALTLINAMADEAADEELANLVGPGKKYRIRATRLVVRIAQEAKGPWVGKIEEPNGPRNPLQIASIKSFVDSLRPILSVRSPVHTFSDDDLLDIILSVWEGVLGLWPKWRGNSQQYAVQRALGLFVIHRVAAQQLIPEMLLQRNRTSYSVTSTLRPSPWLEQEFWRTGSTVSTYSSGAGQKQLAEQIIGTIS